MTSCKVTYLLTPCAKPSWEGKDWFLLTVCHPSSREVRAVACRQKLKQKARGSTVLASSSWLVEFAFSNTPDPPALGGTNHSGLPLSQSSECIFLSFLWMVSSSCHILYLFSPYSLIKATPFFSFFPSNNLYSAISLIRNATFLQAARQNKLFPSRGNPSLCQVHQNQCQSYY